MANLPTNGTAKQTAENLKNGNLTLPREAKSSSTITAPLKSEKATEAETPQTFEERMQRLSQLFELQGKYDKLKQSDDKLKDFTIKGNEGAELELEDSEGNVFSTKNAEIVADVVQFLKMKIAEKRKVLEAQIRW